ncbi:uncharacterized protein LOC117644537 [Thrips palmi]|uniref:Uncharacterized protein LOC117644537 n=1 Tax=Thrips palmi TaxID=161013 RepID=A0A6P8YRK1_THRPL|nr:uncharacterized protein LOC117644537 [Thrips palmi]
MFLTLLPPLALLLGPWGPWGRPVLALGAVVPPSWADPRHNPCAAQPGGWQLLLWPGDGRCYRIFRRGHPCPPHMELTPGVGPGGAPGCRCPPGTAVLASATTASTASNATGTCYPLLEQGPCPRGQYLAPVPAPPDSDNRVPHLLAACRAPDACPPGHVFWARDGRCYPQLTRGPCYRGELLVAGRGHGGTPTTSSATASTATPLGVCRCESRGELGRYFSPLTKTCHEHYTPGPCQEKGLIFLPPSAATSATSSGVAGAPRCGCSADLPHYHPATGQCFQIDTIGPCPAGQRFTTPGKRSGRSGRPGRAQCRCKGGHVPWPRPEAVDAAVDAAVEAQTAQALTACYRPWTRGPCPQGQLLSDASQCVAAPCRPGRLYFPDDAGCYKVGVRGPCPKGQVVLFETAVRPALEGISYRGMCGCTGPAAKSRFASNNIPGKSMEDNRCGGNSPPTGGAAEDKDMAGVKRSAIAPRTEPDCESKSGAIVFNGKCYSLYSQGPCPLGQWLVPQRRGREGRTLTDSNPNLELWTDPEARPRARAKCDCRPGHKPVWVPQPSPSGKSDNSTSVLECQPPTVVLASFLNARGFVTV